MKLYFWIYDRVELRKRKTQNFVVPLARASKTRLLHWTNIIVFRS